MRLSLAATTVATLSGISLAATVCNFTNEGFAAGYWISAQGVPECVPSFFPCIIPTSV